MYSTGEGMEWGGEPSENVGSKRYRTRDVREGQGLGAWMSCEHRALGSA
jgi:hypothetical protein